MVELAVQRLTEGVTQVALEVVALADHGARILELALLVKVTMVVMVMLLLQIMVQAAVEVVLVALVLAEVAVALLTEEMVAQEFLG